MYIKFNLIFVYAVGIILLYILGRYLAKPMRIISKLVFKIIFGVTVLLAVNYAGSTFFEYHIALNAFSVLVTGFLGLPGVLLLIALKFIFLG